MGSTQEISRLLVRSNPVASLMHKRGMLLSRAAYAGPRGDEETASRMWRLVRVIDSTLLGKYSFDVKKISTQEKIAQDSIKRDDNAIKIKAKFSSLCNRCELRIFKDDSIFWDKQNKTVWHVECDSLPVKRSAHVAPATDPGPQGGLATQDNVPEGTYTVVKEDGSYVTIDICAWKGKTMIRYLNGPDNETNFKGFGFVRGKTIALWDDYKNNIAIRKYVDAFFVVAGTPQKGEFRKAYALRSTRCARCHRTLSVPDSILDGLGPECRTKL